MMKSTILALIVAFAVAIPHAQSFKPLFSMKLQHGNTNRSPCNLPPFTEKLPKKYQMQLRAIWSKHAEDEDCSSQLDDTKEFLDNLPDDVRESIRPPPVPGAMCGVPFQVENLQEENRIAIKSIWKDWKEGEDCAEQREAMRYFIENLPESEKMALMRPPVDPEVPPGFPPVPPQDPADFPSML